MTFPICNSKVLENIFNLFEKIQCLITWYFHVKLLALAYLQCYKIKIYAMLLHARDDPSSFLKMKSSKNAHTGTNLPMLIHL